MNGTQLTMNYVFTTVIDVVVYVSVTGILYYVSQIFIVVRISKILFQRNELASKPRHSVRSSDGSLTTIESESDITNFVVHATIVHFICMSLPVVLLVGIDKIHEYGKLKLSIFGTVIH